MHSFYEIPEDVWLFRQAVKTCESDQKRKWTPREEQVRQWCLHELFRTYGINVNNIQIERSVKIGTRTLRADIVILNNGNPCIVIECKARETKAHDDGMNQGISYAAAPDVNAQFAVYTNGDVWWVRRRFKDQWIPVPDLPQWDDAAADLQWRDLVLLSSRLDPLLYWLDQVVPAKQAQGYFSAMQEFFHANNLLTQDSNEHLMWTADNLLRSLSRIDDQPYTSGKMSAACEGLNEFFREMGASRKICPGGFWELNHDAYAIVASLIEDYRGLVGQDFQLLRLMGALFAYVKSLRSAKRIRYADVTGEIQAELRRYLEIVMAIQFSARLPDPLDRIYLGDIRGDCKTAWERHLKDYQQ